MMWEAMAELVCARGSRGRAGGGFDETFTTSEDREVCDRWLARGLRLVYAPDAVVHHAHALTLRSLWRQHFGYGRGARRFHLARAARGAGGFRPEGSFYLKLLRASLSRSRRRCSSPGRRRPTRRVFFTNTCGPAARPRPATRIN
jgi:GT2 family glycosyltransferase